MSFKFNKDHYSITAENAFDNTISIEVSGFEYASINLDMDNNEERKALEDLANYINFKIYERRQKYLEKLGFKKPGPDTVTVGDLVGLKRESDNV